MTAPRRPRSRGNGSREKSKFANGFNAESAVQSFAKKYFASVLQKSMIHCGPSHPGKRGERVVTNVGRDAMDALCVARRAARTRTTKSCGPGAPGLALSLAGDLRGDGDYEVTDTGESTKISVNTIAQGRPDVSVEPVVSNSCAFFTAHEAAGAASARSSLRPLLFEGHGSRKASDTSCRGNAELCPGSSLRAKRSNPEPCARLWIASSLRSSQ
jgi:hypothetical protein